MLFVNATLIDLRLSKELETNQQDYPIFIRLLFSRKISTIEARLFEYFMLRSIRQRKVKEIEFLGYLHIS